MTKESNRLSVIGNQLDREERNFLALTRNSFNVSFLTFLLLFTFHESPFTANAANWKSLSRKGVSEYQKGSFDSAIGAFKRAEALAPSKATLHFNSGCANYKLSSLKDASDSFKNALDLENDVQRQAQNFYNLGNTLFKQNNFSDAAEAYKQTLLLDAKDKDALHNLAVALKRRENPQANKDNSGQKKEKEESEDSSKKDESQTQPKPEENSQEMESLLKAFEDQELKNAQKRQKRKTTSGVEQDW